MSMDNTFIEGENAPERFPSKEEITAVFERLLQGKVYRELRVQSDGAGVYLYEIEVILESGQKVEYNFQKARYDYQDKSLNTEGRFSASIHTVTYSVEGEPDGGECVANYIDGKWEYTS
ncbi:MAG: hypothetical protein AAB767_00825 [Patescibacteria group bacterium]